MAHKNCLLQDEGDGTFSIRAFQRRGAYRNVPLVVSKKTPETVPGVPTSTSAFYAAAAEGQQVRASVPDASISGTTSLRHPPAQSPPRDSLDLDMWQYLISVICLYSSKPPPELRQQCVEAMRAVMASNMLARLLQLPKQRDVQWVANGLSREIQTNGQVKALLIQITGREPAVPCAEVSSFPETLALYRVTLPFLGSYCVLVWDVPGGAFHACLAS